MPRKILGERRTVDAIGGLGARPSRRMPCVAARLISARDRSALTHRRWASGKPRSRAFCRSAPAVRFIALTIFLTGDLLREWASGPSALGRPPLTRVGV